MVTIATWNINSVRLRIDQVERLLTATAPDVLCLQEIKVEERLFPHEMFARLGYAHRVVHGQKGYHGVATVSRLPLRELTRHDWQDNGEARHVGVEVGGAAQGLLLENVYVPAGGDIPDRAQNLKFGQKLDFLERMARWADHVTSPTLIVGDFNVAPLECDVWSHKARIVLFLSAMRHFAESLRNRGWPVSYMAIDGPAPAASLASGLRASMSEHRPQRVVVCEPGELRVRQMRKPLPVFMRIMCNMALPALMLFPAHQFKPKRRS